MKGVNDFVKSFCMRPHMHEPSTKICYIWMHVSNQYLKWSPCVCYEQISERHNTFEDIRKLDWFSIEPCFAINLHVKKFERNCQQEDIPLQLQRHFSDSKPTRCHSSLHEQVNVWFLSWNHYSYQLIWLILVKMSFYLL